MKLNLDEKISAAQTVAIAGHVKPDGDCVSSCLAVCQYIRRYFPQKQVQVFLEPIPRIFYFLQYAEDICEAAGEEDGRYDLFIALDCGDLQRLGKAASLFENAASTLCIDHHVSNRSFAGENYVVPEASSTCELVYDLLPKERITKEIAESLYTGIVTDTGVFQYSCTSESTMRAAGDLMSRGIDFTGIVDRVFFQKTFVQQRIMGRALLNARLYVRGDLRIVASVLTPEDMAECGALPKHLEGIVSQLQNTKDVEASLFLYPMEDGVYKVSIRSSKKVDAAAIAVKYQGGGHVRAAGCSLSGEDPWKMAEMLIRDVCDQVGLPAAEAD